MFFWVKYNHKTSGIKSCMAPEYFPTDWLSQEEGVQTLKNSLTRKNVLLNLISQRGRFCLDLVQYENPDVGFHKTYIAFKGLQVQQWT